MIRQLLDSMVGMCIVGIYSDRSYPLDNCTPQKYWHQLCKYYAHMH